MLIGKVATQTSVPTSTAHPMPRRTARGRRPGGHLQPLSLGGRCQPVARHGERRQGRVGVLERVGGDPGGHGRLELLAEPSAVELGQPGLVAGVGVDPLGEGGHVDLFLGVGQVRGPGRLQPGRVGPAEGDRLLAVPAAGLIPTPGGRDRGQGQNHGRDGLDPAGRGAVAASSPRSPIPRGVITGGHDVAPGAGGCVHPFPPGAHRSAHAPEPDPLVPWDIRNRAGGIA